MYGKKWRCTSCKSGPSDTRPPLPLSSPNLDPSFSLSLDQHTPFPPVFLLLCRLYPSSFSFPSGKAQCEVDQLFLPAGWDSQDLLTKATPSKVHTPHFSSRQQSHCIFLAEALRILHVSTDGLWRV